MQNYYETLNVMNFAETEVVKASYKALMKKYHPDVNKNVDPKIVVKINQAYEILSDKNKKAEYDEKLKAFINHKNNESLNSKNDSAYPVNDGSVSTTSEGINHKVSPRIYFMRLLIAIPIFLMLGISIGYVILDTVSLTNNWTFIMYSFLGIGIGYGMKVVCKSTHKVVGAIAFVITVVSIILPLYFTIYDLSHTYGVDVSHYKGFLDVTSLVIQFFFTEGWLRAILVLIAPFSAFTTVSEEL